MDYSFRRNRIVGGIGADDRYWESLGERVPATPLCVLRSMDVAGPLPVR